MVIGRTALISMTIAVFVGCAAGVGVFTLGYADATAYLSNDPNACANCHVMGGHLDAWVKSSHGKFATCNDCHAPHAFVGKYYCKARNGFFHSLAFTTGNFEDNFRMTEFNRGVTEGACRSCHATIVHQIDLVAGDDQPIACIRCHSTVGHDE
jgi:cytochrome c nitrite reductase small subunit